MIGQDARATSSEQVSQEFNKLLYHACPMSCGPSDWLKAAHCRSKIVLWPFFFALRNLQGIEFSMELRWVLNKLIANHSNEGGCVVLNVTNYVILLSWNDQGLLFSRVPCMKVLRWAGKWGIVYAGPLLNRALHLACRLRVYIKECNLLQSIQGNIVVSSTSHQSPRSNLAFWLKFLQL